MSGQEARIATSFSTTPLWVGSKQAEVMSQEPYKSGRRVFCIIDNCSAHRGQGAADLSTLQWHNPIHPHPDPRQLARSGEFYFSIVQRKVPAPKDFSSLAELEKRLLASQVHYERTASPFKWTPQQTDRKYVTVILNQTI
jgi:hypothetical protein